MFESDVISDSGKTRFRAGLRNHVFESDVISDSGKTKEDKGKYIY